MWEIANWQNKKKVREIQIIANISYNFCALAGFIDL